MPASYIVSQGSLSMAILFIFGVTYKIGEGGDSFVYGNLTVYIASSILGRANVYFCQS